MSKTLASRYRSLPRTIPQEASTSAFPASSLPNSVLADALEQEGTDGLILPDLGERLLSRQPGRDASSQLSSLLECSASPVVLPEETRMGLEQHFGYRLSNIKFTQSPAVTQLGELAYARGNEVRFAPGAFSPHTQEGQEILRHEVAHIITVEIKDQDIALDFTDNPDQVKGAINLPLSALRAAVYYGVRSIVDPCLPANGGYYRAIQIKTRPGCILGCTEPAACAGRSDTAQRVADMVFGAMSQVVPHKVMAGSNSSITGVYFGGVDPKTHEYYVYMETFGGGSGARFNKDGLSCVQVHMTNTSNLPIESMEIEFPYMVEQYTLVPDSGGPGKFRGGLSMRKDIRVLGHDSQFTIKADRQKTPPWGLFGGRPGLPGVITIYPGTEQEAVIDSKKSGTTLKANGVLRCQMPGAGGYGDPMERDRALIVHDLEEGYITPKSALRDYGLTEDELEQIDVFGKV